MFPSVFFPIACHLGIKAIPFSFSRVSFSSQDIQKGTLFFALKGEKTDGHLFLKEVKEKGGVAAVVSKDYQGEDEGLILIRVDSVIDTIHLFAKEYLKQLNPKIIAITGSVGKTTTKEFIATLLEPMGKVWKSPGNANSQVGLPAAILNAPPMDYAVIEMGMNGYGHIEKLVQIAPPDIAVITKIELVHAAFFPDGKKGIAKAKGEILHGKEDLIAIFSEEVKGFEPFASFSKTVHPGQYRKTDQGVYFKRQGQEVGPFVLPFKESHFIQNFVLAATACLELHESILQLQERTPYLTLHERRFEKIEKNNKMIINDAYNAAAASIIAALENLPSPQKGAKTIAVLGSVKELGSFSEEEHKKIGEKAVHSADYILCIGQEALPIIAIAKKKGIPCEYHVQLEELIASLKKIAGDGDVIFLKGSKPHQLWKVVDEI